MSRGKRVLQKVIGKGVEGVSTLEVAANSLLDCSGVAGVVRSTCILSKVVPVYPR